MFEIGKSSYCDRCRRTCEAGSRMIRLRNGRFWCKTCAEYPLVKSASFADNCSKCGVEIKEGELKGWSPIHGAWCYYCVKGKDSGESKLSNLERKEYLLLLERVQRLSALPAPLSPNATFELAQLKAVLKKKFGQLVTAKRVLALLETGF